MKSPETTHFPENERDTRRLLHLCAVAAAMVMGVWISGPGALAQEAAQPSQTAVKSAPALGTIKSISGNTLGIDQRCGR